MAQVIFARDNARSKQLNSQKNKGWAARIAQAVALSFVLGGTVAGGFIAQPAQAQSFRFTTVEVSGNARIDSATVLSYAGIGKGTAVSAAQLNDAYQRLVGSGLFEQVVIDPRGSHLVISVVEYPTVNLVRFEGNKRLKDEDIAGIVQSASRRVFSPSMAEADAQRISEAYVAQGRIAARVTPRVIRRSDNRVDLVFEVFEGGVTEIERITFTGNSQYSDRRLRRVLETKQAGILRAVIRKDTFIEDRIEFDKQLLRDFYASRGFVDFQITGVNAELAQERDGHFVSFHVIEGQQFRVGEVTVTSDLAEVDVDMFERAVRMRSNKVYSPILVENEIARLERLAVREGLNFIQVVPRVTRNDRDLTLDVELQVTKGERLFVERIDVKGNTTTLDRVVRQKFDVVEGDPFNPRAIRASAERIRSLGFFTKADVNAREGTGPDQVIVDVDVEEKPTGSFSFGGSYSTSSGIGANISFAEQNFLGRGQSLSFAVSTTSSDSNYAFAFADPGFLSRDLTFGFSISYNESSSLSDDYTINSGRFRPYLAFPLSENARLQARYTYALDDVAEVTDSSAVGDIIFAESKEGETRDSSIGYTFSYDTRRTGLNPKAGFLLEFNQDFGGIGGNRSFVKTTAKAVAQTLIMSEEVTLRASIEGGLLDFSKGRSRVSDRFSIGPSIMRGFEYGGIGPREIGGSIDASLGGEKYAVAKFEALFPLGLPEEYGITGGAFYDIGALWDGGDRGTTTAGHSVESNGFVDRHVVGVSILWDSMLGPLRMDFSEAVKSSDHDKEANFNLGISTNF